MVERDPLVQRGLRAMVGLGMGLPVLGLVLGGIAHLLHVLGDPAGGTGMARAALVITALWIADMSLLLLTLGVFALQKSDASRSEK